MAEQSQAKGVTPDIVIAPGKVPTAKKNEFLIKEAELKKHLKAEIDKLDKKKSKKKSKKKN